MVKHSRPALGRNFHYSPDVATKQRLSVERIVRVLSNTHYINIEII